MHTVTLFSILQVCTVCYIASPLVSQLVTKFAGWQYPNKTEFVSILSQHYMQFFGLFITALCVESGCMNFVAFESQ